MKTTHSHIKMLSFGAAGIALLGSALTMRPSVQAATKASSAEKSKAKSNRKDKVVKTKAQWKRILTPAQFDVLREQGTEEPGSGALLNEHRKGVFVCAADGNKLFLSGTKFESGTGWPSFYAPIKNAVIERPDADGSGRAEVICARCDGHLGHVFDDGPKPTGLRYCMNSVAMKFVKQP